METSTLLQSTGDLIISKIVKIPRDKWQFSSTGSSNHFYLILDGFRYGLYISGGALTSFQISSETIHNDKLSITPNDELRAYTNKLFDDLQKQEDFRMLEVLKKIDTSLNKIIESV